MNIKKINNVLPALGRLSWWPLASIFRVFGGFFVALITSTRLIKASYPDFLLQGFDYKKLSTKAGWWFQPLWEIWKSVGMIIPNIWKSKIDVPNHQPDSHCIPLSFRIIPFKLPQVRWIDGSSLRWIDSQRLTGSIGWCFGLVVWNPRISLAEHRYGLSQEPPTQTILEEPVEFWHSQCIYIYVYICIYIHYTYISLHMYIYIYMYVEHYTQNLGPREGDPSRGRWTYIYIL